MRLMGIDGTVLDVPDSDANAAAFARPSAGERGDGAFPQVRKVGLVEVDSGERIVVGVNKFTLDVEEPYEPLRVDPTIEKAQRDRLATLRRTRNAASVSNALSELEKAAAGTANVLYPMREALRARATVGEVCHTLRGVWGTYQPRETF
jgi:methylmalonyl-CoA mutase N-terminal domain/subunit